MVSQRDRVIAILNYLQSLGIDIQFGNVSTKGKKGQFKVRSDEQVIKITKYQGYDETLLVLAHEFAHYVHHCYDKDFVSLDFAFNEPDEIVWNELTELTVQKVPKNYAGQLINEKQKLKQQIDDISSFIKKKYPDFRMSKPFGQIENAIRKTDAKYLLKYDRVKVQKGFDFVRYSIDMLAPGFLGLNETDIAYIQLQSLRRNQNRISSGISKMNKYYGEPTELFARFMEYYFSDKKSLKKIAPHAYKIFKTKLAHNEIPLISDFENAYECALPLR